MTLLDGRPLSEREVELRCLCQCGHPYGQHSPRDGRCHWCACEGFKEKLLAPSDTSSSGDTRR